MENIFQPRKVKEREVLVRKELELKYNVNFDTIDYRDFHVILTGLAIQKEKLTDIVAGVGDDEIDDGQLIYHLFKLRKIHDEYDFLYQNIFQVRFTKLYLLKQELLKKIRSLVKDKKYGEKR